MSGGCLRFLPSTVPPKHQETDPVVLPLRFFFRKTRRFPGTCAGSGRGTADGNHRTHAFRNETWQPKEHGLLEYSIACSGITWITILVIPSGSDFFWGTASDT